MIGFHPREIVTRVIRIFFRKNPDEHFTLILTIVFNFQNLEARTHPRVSRIWRTPPSALLPAAPRIPIRDPRKAERPKERGWDAGLTCRSPRCPSRYIVPTARRRGMNPPPWGRGGGLSPRDKRALFSRMILSIENVHKIHFSNSSQPIFSPPALPYADLMALPMKTLLGMGPTESS